MNKAVELPPVKHSEKTQNAFIDGRREWNAQFGRPIAEANWWRMVAFVTSVIALVSLVSLAKLGFSTKVVPYVVLIDDLGQPIATGLASDATGGDDPRVRKSLVSNFLLNVRSVTSDGTAQKERIQAAYAMMSGNDPAFQTLNEWFQSATGDPFERAKEITVNVKLSSLLQLSDNTYQAEWKEIIRDRVGQVVGQDDYQGVLTVRQTDVLSGGQLLTNPIGLFISEFTWTKRI